MYYDVSNPKADTGSTESKDLATEVDCVNWCESKKQNCVTVNWVASEGKCYISDQKEALVIQGPNEEARLTMYKEECFDGYWRPVADLCKPDEPDCV